MPFQSEKQRRFLHANHPEIAKRWEKEYATGGISNHFRRKFFTGALADTQGPAGGQAMSPGTSTSGGTRHSGGGGNGGSGGGDHHPPVPVYTGPTAEEIAAQKAADEARLQALEDARRNQIYKNTMAKRKKNIKYYDKNLKSKFDTPTWDTEPYFSLYNKNKTIEDYYHQIDETDVPLNFFEKQHLNELENLEKIKFENEFKEREGFPTEKLMYPPPGNLAELTESQKDWINKEKSNLKRGFKEPQHVFETINNPALGKFEKNTFNLFKGPQELTTPKEFNDYLKEILPESTLPKVIAVGAKGGVARKNYYHGGILDINESEEIISDDGNDIELTAYNAAFDGPTGVKSLFQAKDGGTPRRRYFTGAYGVGGTENIGSTSSGNGGYQNVHQTGAVTQTPGRTTSTADDNYWDKIRRDDIRKDIEEREDEKYDTDLEGMSDAENYVARRNMIKSKYTATSSQRKNNLTTNYNNERDRLQKKITTDLIKKGIFFWAGGGFDIKDFVGIDWKNKKIDITGVLGDVMDLDKLKKTHINDLEDIKDSLLVDVDIFNPNEMANLDDTVFPDLMKDLKDLYKTRDPDDIENNEFRLPKIVPIGEEIEAFTQPGPHLMSPWEQIKANQAARAAAIPDWQLTAEERELKNNPIVMTGNSGGLANLFRVKNQ
jgi:hypothetical protein